MVEGENQVPPDQNSTDKVLIGKLNEILAKKDQVIDDLISLNETLKKKNCETLEKERRKLEEKVGSLIIQLLICSNAFYFIIKQPFLMKFYKNSKEGKTCFQI